MGLDLAHLAALLEAHQELVIAVEDFNNGCLSEGHRKRLEDALNKSRRLINQEEGDDEEPRKKAR